MITKVLTNLLDLSIPIVIIWSLVTQSWHPIIYWLVFVGIVISVYSPSQSIAFQFVRSRRPRRHQHGQNLDAAMSSDSGSQEMSD